jgi:hypothetical protein
MPSPLSEARIRTQRYWFRDGLEEITLGIICWLMGGLNLARGKALWFVPATLILMAFFVPRIKTALRERITYPRSGYADYGASRRRLRGVLFMAVALASFVPIVLAVRYARCAGWDLDRWLPAVTGLSVGAMATYVSVRHRLPRFLVVGLLSIILGVAVSVAYPPRLAIAIFSIGVGCAFLCSGGVTLRSYLRTAPASADAT